MGLNLGGRKRGTRAAKPEPEEPEAGSEEEEEAPKPRGRRRSRKEAPAATPGKQKAKPGAVASFMRRGKAASEEAARAKKRQEANRRGTFRYWMKPGEEKVVTFLDGGLDKDGLLNCPQFYEHTVPHGGKFADVVCAARNEDPETERTGRCAVCDAGGDKSEPAFVGAFTVAEWCDEPWKDSKGNEHFYRRRLFVAKIKTLEMLQAKATKLAERHGTDGLVGVTFEVTRTGDRDARVGNMFELLSVTPAEEFSKGLVHVGDDVEELEADSGTPLDYSQEFRLFTAEEMEDLGFGAAPEKQFGRSRRRAAGRGKSIEDDL